MDLPIDVDELLRREGSDVEWKRNVANADSVVKTLTAFANNFSGTLTEGWVVLPSFLEQPSPGATLHDLRRVAAEEFIQQARLPLPAEEYLKPDVRIDALARPLVVAQPVAGGGVEPVPMR